MATFRKVGGQWINLDRIDFVQVALDRDLDYDAYVVRAWKARPEGDAVCIYEWHTDEHGDPFEVDVHSDANVPLERAERFAQRLVSPKADAADA